MEIIALHSKKRKKGDEVSFLLVERLDRKWPLNNCSINCWREILSTNSRTCNFHAFLQNCSFTSRVFQLISLLFSHVELNQIRIYFGFISQVHRHVQEETFEWNHLEWYKACLLLPSTSDRYWNFKHDYSLVTKEREEKSVLLKSRVVTWRETFAGNNIRRESRKKRCMESQTYIPEKENATTHLNFSWSILVSSIHNV